MISTYRAHVQKAKASGLNMCDLLVGTRHYPPNIKLLKAAKETLQKGVKYVQS